MSRQINLFTTDYRPKPKPFSAVWIVSAAGVVLAVNLAYYALQVGQLENRRAARNISDTQIKQLREQVAAAGQRTRKAPDKSLEEQVAQAEALLKNRQELSVWLESGHPGNREGYAGILAALARQRVEGVWLTGIEISGSDRDFVLKGRAVRADLLPDYIKVLRKEAAFRGKSISALQLTQAEIDPNANQKKAPGGADNAPPAAQVQAGQAAARPRIRVVEFAIGSETAAGPGAGSR